MSVPVLRAFHPTANLRALVELTALLKRFRTLVVEMTRRDLTEQYVGQVFGALWIVGHPLLMAALYVFVFAFIFKMRIGGTPELPLDFTAYLLAGLTPWLSFQLSMTKGCSALLGQANLVKQVVFPIEILPTKAVIASLLPQLVMTAVLVIYTLIVFGGLHASYLLLPVLMIAQTLAMLGVAFILAMGSAFLRDLKEVVQVFGLVGLYVMPIVYLPEWVPSLFKPLLYLNPFSYMIWCYQDALYFGRFEHPWAWPVFLVGSVATFAVGYRAFRFLKPYVGDVL